ncbi:hypothetical protein SHKM778_26230 [Streptomyces sp. KM77-8]|uniref:Uncharacterized protein n=1 Tax=Streptomyces haneummycinicus TaxID=3074435 RepID=A0AAT9HFN1_9ACTN
MIEDWYFCAAMRDTPHAAHAYLAVLDVLDAPVALDETLPDALEALDGCEPWTALHVVPRLLTLATGGGESADLCMEHLLGTVVGTAGGGPVGEALTAAVRACADERPSRAAARLRHAVQVWGRDATPRTTQEPFRELTHYPRETILLAVTAHLARLPGAAEDIASDLRHEDSWLDELTRRAARHEWGRLPFLLALRALGGTGSTGAERDRLLKALCRPAVGWADLEPDLMGAAARLLHLGTGQEAEPTVTALDTDAVTLDGLRRLRRLRGDSRPVTGADRVLGRLGLPAGKPAPPPSPPSCGSRSSGTSRPGCTRTGRGGPGGPVGRARRPAPLSGAVQRPGRRQGTRRLGTSAHRPLAPADRTARPGRGERLHRRAGGQNRPPRHAQTPGCVRLGLLTVAGPGADRRERRGRKRALPAVHDPVVLLRLLSSLRTAVRLMRHGVDESRFLADLVMHGAEVLAEGRLGAYMLNLTHGTEKHEDAPLPTVLVPLALAAYRTGTYALRGCTRNCIRRCSRTGRSPAPTPGPGRTPPSASTASPNCSTRTAER